MDKTYTIEQIRSYLKGYRLGIIEGEKEEWKPVPNANDALNFVIQFLECDQDGIEAMAERDKQESR
jgi:hypothetical protein